VRAALQPRLGEPNRRLRFAVVLCVMSILVLGGRLVQLQGLESTAYAARGEAERLRTSTVASLRGAITDRWGKVLARNVASQLIAVDPTLIKDKVAAASSLASALGRPAADIQALLDRPGRYVVLARGLDVITARATIARRIPGVVAELEQRREHPAGAVAAQVVGVTRTDGPGLAGTELTMDKVLAGRPGTLTEEIDPGGRVIPGGERREQPAQQGQDVRLTIDRDLQYVAQTTLDEQVRNSNARGGNIVVMDPRSGEILAIASSPGYDASKWPDVDSRSLSLKAVTDVYEPGSVNKVITAAAALDLGLVSPSTSVTVEPVLHVAGRAQPIRDAEPHGTEHLTFAGVLARSSNIGTVHIAQQVTSPRLDTYLRGFGLGSSTHSGLPGESAGLLPAEATWNPSQAATIPFGQGMSATALQIASVYSTVANGGLRVTPTVVRGTVDTVGRYRAAARPPPVRVIKMSTAVTLSQVLEAVLTDTGTAPLAAIPGYRVAGKTGTAQAITDGRYDGGFVSSFVGFAPADKPRLVVSVSIDHPQGAYFGGIVAAPVFRQVMSAALRSYRIPPTATRAPVLRQSYDEPPARTP
jgi:cell division protein FtsI (penicillin-binding protein 3)